MSALAFFPESCQLETLQVDEQGDVVTLHARSTAVTAACPECGQVSARVHSRYGRTLTDLPFATKPVHLTLVCRRFFCDNTACPRRTFAERLPRLTSPYGRTTKRLDEAHRHLAFATGGEAGARLAAHLHMPTSADTLLRRLRGTTLPQPEPPRVVGVDDWALRKGQRYGTIVCDLEGHRPIDLLPERSAEGVAAWLQEQPQVAIISRDRGDEYIRGATQGAPTAVQVADRFHLVKNGHEALQRVVDRLHKVVRQAAQTVFVNSELPPPAAPETLSRTAAEPLAGTPPVVRSSVNRARRQQSYEQARQLHTQGLSQRAIADQLDLDRGTVRRYVQADTFPERAARRVSRSVDRFAAYLRQRWQEGCHNAQELTTEIRGQGFTGSYYMVRRLLARWRPAEGAASRSQGRPPCPSTRQVSWWLLRAEADLEEQQRAFVQEVQRHSPELATATILVRAFAEMVREQQAARWPEWLEQLKQPGVAKELQAFAAGLQADEAAVKAALTLPWSNGQVEGQINRLKTLKRQMYGRAGFGLLRTRFLHRG